MKKPEEEVLWQQLMDTLNALDDAGLNVHFGDRMGPETDWRTAPHVYAGNRHGGTHVAWDRKKRCWVIEHS
ncbi:hypothetical protein AB0L75_16330 [Streptomyces sp. NPDC052101]|uniref:hypothetical protein n=1 Tax=Streptomyces sp. NPDC052101 TaxID=3155763 RepID=UPI0034209538